MRKVNLFKTTVSGIGPFCVECEDGEIITTRSERRQKLIAEILTKESDWPENYIPLGPAPAGKPQPQAPTEAEYCAQCHKLIMKQDVNYGINPDAVCMCGRPK